MAFATPAPMWLRLIGVVGILWNSLGVISYLGYVGVIAPMDGDMRSDMPVIAHAGYAIGVFAGVVGSLGLALARRWARPLLWLLVVGMVLDWGWVFGWSGQGVSPLGVAVLVISLLLALVADHAMRGGWLR